MTVSVIFLWLSQSRQRTCANTSMKNSRTISKHCLHNQPFRIHHSKKSLLPLPSAITNLKLGIRLTRWRALKIDETVYGLHHPQVATQLNNLGLVLQDLGDLKGARTNLERALKILTKIFSSDHPKTITAQSSLDFLTKKENEQKNS